VCVDYELTNFDHELTHDSRVLIPLVLRAQNLSQQAQNHALRLFTTPWSPPGWMKTNGKMTSSANPGLKAEPAIHKYGGFPLLFVISDFRCTLLCRYRAWALYISYYISAYARKGINFWGLTVQNEPEFNAPWEACIYTPEQQRDFIKNFLGPTIKERHGDAVNIMIYDHNKDHIVRWASTIFSDPEAAQFVWGTGISLVVLCRVVCASSYC
jgi:glucosylceramidase